jgi:hypothetical protein
MRNPANTLFIVVAVGSGVVAIAFICANAFPWETPLPMSSASEITVTNYHHRCYGWPAIYATVTSHGSPRIVAEARFSLWALLVNLGLVSSLSALIWTTYFILRAKRLSLAALFMVITYIAVMVACITQVGESSLPREPTTHPSLWNFSHAPSHAGSVKRRESVGNRFLAAARLGRTAPRSPVTA